MAELDAVPIQMHLGNSEGHHTVSSETLFTLTEAYEEVFGFLEVKIEIQIGVPKKGSWECIFWIIGFIGVSPWVTAITGMTPEEWLKLNRPKAIQYLNQIFTKRVEELPEDIPHEFYRRRNKLFHRLEVDTTVTNIKIGEEPLIPRQDFPLYIAKTEDEEPTYIGEREIMISSPDWKGKRSWKGRVIDSDEKIESFRFDPHLTGKFWERVKFNQLSLQTEDAMKVQLALYPSDKPKHTIIRVLEYNGQTIDVPLSNSEIDVLFENRQDTSPSQPDQTSLF